MLPTVQETAAYYRERKIACVIFPVDAERETGFRRYENEEVAKIAADNADIMIPFASIDPAKGKMGAREATPLVRDFGVKGFKFHPTMQAFYPNDRDALCALRGNRREGAIALFHTGQTGVGAGMRGGMNMRLKYSNPIHLDDVAADFPDMPIILAHPSFPWQEEALAVATHKPNVYIDMSGWSPKYFPRDPDPLCQHDPETQDAIRLRLAGNHARPLAQGIFAAIDIRDEVRPLILKENARKLLAL